MKLDIVMSKGQEDSLVDALCQALRGKIDSLPVERFCQRGGWPQNVKPGRPVIVENNPQKLVVRLEVAFVETVAACCSGDNREEDRFGELIIEIDRKDGHCSFPRRDDTREQRD